MCRNERGLTLLEIMAATVLLGILVIVFMNVSFYTSASYSSDDRKEAALLQAQEVMTYYRNLYASKDSRLSAANTTTSIDSNVLITGYPGTVRAPFVVTVQHSAIINKNAAQYNLQDVGSKRVSLQSIILIRNSTNNTFQPRLLTVIVSWDGV